MKELIENSLDAGATHIRITLKDGGIKSLQVQDNGHGIRRSDLPLLCERFATSKLRTFADLSNMHTFGFRGEALASISYVSASVQVVTKRRDETCAYRTEYLAGAVHSDPKPCAGTNGTSITAYDMFFNAPQRRRALRSASEEYNRALDIATKYALHYGARGVSFSCKKADHASMDLQSTCTSQSTLLDTIRAVYGTKLTRDLVELPEFEDNALGFRAHGWFSNANWVSKKTSFICFINDRLVESLQLRRALESVYSLILPKGQHPWMYLALEIEPHRIDVNVHPTKQEVHFLDEDEITELVCARLQEVLAKQSSCRVYTTHSTLPLGEVTSEDHVQVTRARTYDPRHLVRVDRHEQTLDGMLPSQCNTQDKIPQSHCELTSIAELRDELLSLRDERRTVLLHNHSFVGVVDLERGLCLLQHSTQLYLVQYGPLIEEFGYQLALQQFGALTSVRLDPPPSLRELIGLGFDMEQGEKHAAPLGLSRSQVIERIARKVLSRADMLKDYFGIFLDAERGIVEAVPTLLPQHGSFGLCLDRLPLFFFRLGPQVDWDDEKGCFFTLCRELGLAHVPPSWGTESTQPVPTEQREHEAWIVQHVWFANMHGARGRCIVPTTLPDVFTQVANLPDLYRVFERC